MIATTTAGKANTDSAAVSSYFSAHSVADYMYRLYRRAGLPVDDMYLDCGVDPYAFDRSSGRFPHHVTSVVWGGVERKSSDRHIGLHLGECAEFIPTNLVYHIMRASTTVADALQLCVKYQRLLSDAVDAGLTITGGKAKFKFNLRYDVAPPTRHQLEFWITNVLGQISNLTEDSLCVNEVHYQHDAPCDTREYEASYNCAVHFGREENAIIMPADQLKLPVSSANSEVVDLLCRRANDTLTMIRDESMTARVRCAMHVEMQTGDDGMPDVESIAVKLVVSGRTLQRKLAAENTSYAELLDEARRDHALQCVRDPNKALAEIGYRLGYSEVSCFYRAFRRWMGMTPGEYRSRHVAQPS